MRYPHTLAEKYGTLSEMAEVLSQHPEKPDGRQLTRAAVSKWRARDKVPWCWRPAVSDLLADRGEAG
jgi:hypothetical protein